MEEVVTKKCLNCDTPLAGGFCHHCGQKDIPKRLTWKEVSHDVIGSLFGVQKGFLKTFKDLSFRPGISISNYLVGHRKLYQSPIQYYLIATTLLFIVYNYFHLLENISDTTINAQLEGAGKEAADKQKEIFAKLSPIFNNMRLVVALVPPLLAVAFKWFFSKKSGYTYIEHLVFAIFVVAHSSFVSLPVSPIAAWLGGPAVFLSTIVSLLYICWAAKVFYQTNWFKAIISYIVGYILFMFVFSFVIILPFAVYVVLKSKGVF